MNERWWFYPPGDLPFNTETPELLSGFLGWKLRKGDGHRILSRRPMLRTDAGVLVGSRQKSTLRSEIKCTTACKRAHEPVCICSCGGRNHGKELEINLDELEPSAPEHKY